MKKTRNLDEELCHTDIKSPLGDIIVGEHKGKICIVEFKGGKRAIDSLKAMSAHYGATLSKKKTPALKSAEKQLRLYFSGKLKAFDLPLDYTGTEFQKSVWKQLKRIPFGRTVNYGWIAEKAGACKASRAAGSAIGKNRLSIVIPCHRVVGRDGSLTGFGGGLWRKEWLLKHEGAI